MLRIQNKGIYAPDAFMGFREGYDRIPYFCGFGIRYVCAGDSDRSDLNADLFAFFDDSPGDPADFGGRCPFVNLD